MKKQQIAEVITQFFTDCETESEIQELKQLIDELIDIARKSQVLRIKKGEK